MKILIVFTFVFFVCLSGFTQGLEKRYFENNPELEKLQLPAIKKAKSGLDWWEPDTLYTFYTDRPSWDSRTIFEYDLQGLLLEEVSQYEENNLWINSNSTTYTYDSKNNMLTKLDKSGGINSYLSTYTYDSNNNMLSETQQTWDNNSWKNFRLYTYTYDSKNNMLTMLNQEWKNNSWINSHLTICTYDPNNNMLTYLYLKSNNNLWTIAESYICTYDSNNNLINKQYQRWSNASGANYYSYTYTYDSNDNLLTVLMQRMVNDSWANFSQTIHTYDSNNNLLTILQQEWRNDSWINDTQYLMTYDENGNGISAECWWWKNESWQPSLNSMYNYITLWLYYNSMQSSLGRTSDKMTASYKKIGSGAGVEDVKTASPVQIYSAGKTIHVNNSTGKTGMISVYGIDGVKIAEQTTISQTTALEISVSGFYIVSVKAGNEKPVTAKLIVR